MGGMKIAVPGRSREEVVVLATAVLHEMQTQGIARETACRIVGDRVGLARWQVRRACIRATRRGWVAVPARPVFPPITTKELEKLGQRMIELRRQRMPTTKAARIVADEIGRSAISVYKHWREGLESGRWQDPSTYWRHMKRA